VFEPHLPDDVSVRRWVAVYVAYFLLLAVPLVMLLVADGNTWDDWTGHTAATFRASTAAAKLLALALYVSLCCTFLPLPSMWMVSAVATQQVAVTGDVWTTTLIVAVVGAFGSMMANLNDYHIFTWMLRHHRIAAVRHTRTYRRAARWFSRSPFLILVVFNLIPIPVDVVRMLATTYRYPRVPFAAANYVGRLIRYAVIAFVTYKLADYGWVATVALLGFALALGLGRVMLSVVRRVRGRGAVEEATAEGPSRES
jgi:membrane protein YqaA with SNARE-associated domain